MSTTGRSTTSGTPESKPLAPGPSSPKEDRSQSVGAASWGIALLFFVLYVLTWDRKSHFDGIVSASAVEHWKPGSTLTWLFSDDRFLFNALGWIAYRGLWLLGFSSDGYQTLQLLSTLAAVLTLLMIMRLMKGLSGSLSWAVSGAVLLGLTRLFWTYAVTALPLVAASAAIVAAFVAMSLFLKDPKVWKSRFCAFLGILPAYFHTGAVILVLPLLTVLLVRSRGRRLKTFAESLAIWVLVGIPYIYVQRLYDPSGFSRWLSHGSGALHWYGDLDFTKTAWSLDLLAGLLNNFKVFWQGGVVQAGFWGAFPLSVSLISLLVSCPAERSGDAGWLGPWLIFLWLTLLTFVAFYTFWQPGNDYYWSMHWAIFVTAFMALAVWVRNRGWMGGLRRGQRRILLIAGFASSLATGILNATDEILYSTREEHFPKVVFCKWLGHALSKKSLVIMSGLKGGELKIYLTYYAGIPRVNLELLLRSYPKPRAYAELLTKVNQAYERGWVIAAMSDLWDPEVRFLLEKNWGVTSGELDLFLGVFQRSPLVVFHNVLDGEVYTFYRLTPKGSPDVERKPSSS